MYCKIYKWSCLVLCVFCLVPSLVEAASWGYSDNTPDNSGMGHTVEAFYGCKEQRDCKVGLACVDNGGDGQYYCKPICRDDYFCRGWASKYPQLRCYPHKKANGEDFGGVCNDRPSYVADNKSTNTSPKPTDTSPESKPKAGKDYTNCVQIYDTKFDKCTGHSGMSMQIRNTCNIDISAEFCIERTNGTWECGRKFKLAPSEETSYFACNSTGKYKYIGCEPFGNCKITGIR